MFDRTIYYFISFLGALFPIATFGEERLQGTIFIETRILDFDPVSGMKSTQRIAVFADRDNQSMRVNSTFTTGTTFGIPAVRNRFSVANVSYDLSEGKLSFLATGQTASGVLVMPDIDYSFQLSFDGSNHQNKWTLQGCHDGYPAYKVWLENAVSGETTELYEFIHRPIQLLNLLGNCDILLNKVVITPD